MKTQVAFAPAFLLLFAASLCGQNPAQDHYWNTFKIEHGSGTATVSADDGRPLWMALNALKKEYGWSISYEEPIYSETETAPAHNGVWDSRHPERPSRAPAGHSFTARYPEDANTATSRQQQLAIVKTVVSSYDSTQNPGTFRVIVLGNGQIDVVGQSRAAATGNPGLLDTAVAVPPGTMSAAQALSNFVEALSSTSGVPVKLGVVSFNILAPAHVELTPGSASARSILETIASSGRVSLDWDLLYDWNSSSYFLSLEPQSKIVTDRMGNQVIRWVPKGSQP